MIKRSLSSIEDQAIRIAMLRIIPFLALLYFVSFLDRVNIGFAALTMNADIGLSATAFGVGAGIFFIGYTLMAVPASMALQRMGATRWLSTITILWGCVSGAMAFVTLPAQFYVLRLALGVTEAGFLPAVIYYLGLWFPSSLRGRIIGRFFAAVPVSNVLGAPLSAWLLNQHILGLRGWQTMFVIEALPAILLGVLASIVLADSPRHAKWLTMEQRRELEQAIIRDAPPDLDSAAGRSSIKSLPVWLLGALYFLIVMGLYGFGFWGPQILQTISGLTGGALGWALAVPYLVAAVMMQPWAKNSDVRNERIWHIALPAFVGAAGFAAASQTTSLAPTILAFALATTGIYVACPVFWALPGRLLTGSAAASGIALINALGNLAGYLGPIMMGWLKDRTGSYAAGMLVLAASMATAGLLALVIGRLITPPPALPDPMPGNRRS